MVVRVAFFRSDEATSVGKLRRTHPDAAKVVEEMKDFAERQAKAMKLEGELVILIKPAVNTLNWKYRFQYLKQRLAEAEMNASFARTFSKPRSKSRRRQ